MKTTCPALTIALLVTFACVTNVAAQNVPPTMEVVVAPAIAMYGEPFSWKVVGLKPGETVTVKATSKDARRQLWESEAVFEAGPTGKVDLAIDAPRSGRYTDPDIFGLLWSMQPVGVEPGKRPSYRDDEVNGWTVNLTATDSKGAKAEARFRCVFQRPDQPLVRIPLEKDGLVGFLYAPSKGGPFPGVIILGGSNGGLYEWLAQAFASNGFAALTLAYFRYPNLPDELVGIPLEYFDRAAAWMKARPEVAPGRLGLAGGSKGGELALILAARNPDYQAVVAWTPAAHAWEGHTKKFFAPDYEPVPSWTVDGRPLPYMRLKASLEQKALEQKGELKSFLAMHRDSFASTDPALVEQAAIPVEKIRAPILLVSGTDDQTWPSGEFCASIVARLRESGFRYEVTHIINEGGGHQSFLPYFVTASHTGGFSGGSPHADGHGGYRSWAETISFLHRHLDPARPEPRAGKR